MEMADREKNKQLFHRLLNYAGQQKYDDDFLQALIEFWQFAPENEVDGNILYAAYALHHKSYAVAYEYGKKAYAKRKINWRLWQILRDSSYALGKMDEAFLYAGFADKFYRDPVQLDIPRHELQQALDMLSLGMGRGGFAPVAESRVYHTERGTEAHAAIFAGEFLPQEGVQDIYRLFSAAYVEQEMLDNKGKLLACIKDIPEVAMICGADFVFDLLKVADKGNQCRISADTGDVVAGFIGSAEKQRLEFQSAQGESSAYLGKWAVTFFRMQADTEVVSDKQILCTRPVKLRHDKRRCKVVLNILLDGLCWRAVQEENYALVPNLLNFFRKGVIFSNHYSVAEYTFPSLATIETGLYPWHSQIFNERSSHTLSREHKSISERLQEQGYYCVNIMGDGAGVYNGIFRGYDRLLVNAYDNRVYQGVERTLHHMEAFGGTDQFIFLHTADTHPWGLHSFQLPLTTQLAMPLVERSLLDADKKTSVYLPKRPVYCHWNSQGIKDCDAALARLFAYLEENYAEDEYLISVYSDHGVPIYDEQNYVLSCHQTGAAWMMRGRNVPQAGFVDELTSAVDLYAAWAHCLGFTAVGIDGNLPAVFGGQVRDYTVSMSMFPGIPYMACLRTAEYECRAESREILDEDGRTDLADMKMAYYYRNTDKEVHDAAVAAYFRQLLRQETAAIDNYGTQWKDMRAARAEWFDRRKKEQADG